MNNSLILHKTIYLLPVTSPDVWFWTYFHLKITINVSPRVGCSTYPFYRSLCAVIMLDNI